MSGTESGNQGGTSSGTKRYSVPQAARYLGISERAVRKRIEAGTLAATRDGIRWLVELPSELEAVLGAVPSGTSGGAGTASSAEPTEPINAQYRVTPAEIEQAIERTGDKYVIDMRAMFERLDELYRDRLADKDRLVLALERERDDERQRREAAETRLSELEAKPAESPAHGANVPQVGTGDVVRPSWRDRLRSLFR